MFIYIIKPTKRWTHIQVENFILQGLCLLVLSGIFPDTSGNVGCGNNADDGDSVGVGGGGINRSSISNKFLSSSEIVNVDDDVEELVFYKKTQ